jgi:succinyl-CoA synthetase beta subunit
MVAEALDIARETYLAILMDRDSNGPVMVRPRRVQLLTH